MSARLRGIARQNEEIIKAGGYRSPSGREVPLAEAVAAAVAGTEMFGPEPVPVPVAGLRRDGTKVKLSAAATPTATAFEVTAESSTLAARRLARTGPVAVLNFASARNPGGGYVNGAQAQEEALCRASALYPTLLRVPDFYAHHRAERSAFYTDRVIHSPAVPVFRDDRGRLLDEPYTAGFLTCPAPNAGVIRRREPEEAACIPAVLAARAERVLETAAACGYPQLVLGAWGCGVFQNDPAQVAAAFRTLLTGDGRFSGHFDRVVFGVLDRRPDSPTRVAFAEAFADQVQP
ncbi:TIGR02452 family protein [Streptomyces sp. NPDC051219]|uniref:TIGR02452 family protein n=1 Tax=Streptomyces sp. NPDC051219 TaxID=3155283 RepID=UPI00342986DB